MPHGLRAMRRPLMRDPRLLIDWIGGTPFPAGAYYSRSSDGLTRDADGVWRPCAADTPRTARRRDAAGLPVPITLLELAATNYVPNSCRYDPGMGWGGITEWTVSAAASVIAGQTAWRHANLGTGTSRFRRREVGQFSGSPESLYWLIEGVDASTSEVALFDTTAGAVVCQVRLTWASGEAAVVAGTGDARLRHLGTGPNGGPLYLLGLTATGPSGNGRRVEVYPTGVTQNTRTVILHHAQLETTSYPTSPIVTDSDAATRARDTLYLELPPEIEKPGAALAVYSRFVMLYDPTIGFNASPIAWAITGASGTGPRLYHYAVTTDGTLRLRYDADNTSSNFKQAVGPKPDPGDLVETLSLAWSDDNGMIAGRLISSVNGGPITGSQVPPHEAAAAWSGTRFYIGSRSASPGMYEYERLRIWAGRLSGDDHRLMALARGEI